MEIKIISTGSHGNCTVITCGDEQVVCDFGISQYVLKYTLDFNKKIKFFHTHEHSDHYKEANKRLLTRVGGVKLIHGVGDTIAYPVKHSCPNLAYSFTVGGKRILYATDYSGRFTSEIREKFDVIFLEYNHNAGAEYDTGNWGAEHHSSETDCVMNIINLIANGCINYHTPIITLHATRRQLLSDVICGFERIQTACGLTNFIFGKDGLILKIDF